MFVCVDTCFYVCVQLCVFVVCLFARSFVSWLGCLVVYGRACAVFVCVCLLVCLCV